MAETELLLTDETSEEFIRNERPLWPYVASSCVVPECDQTVKFSSFRDFLDHWRDRHIATSTHYKCSNCKRLFANMKHAKGHTKSRCHKGQTITLKHITEKNENYMDPAGHLPYKLGSKEDRANMRTVQRHLASEERKRLTAKRDQSIVISSGDGICRDERVVDRNGTLFRDSNMWDTPNKRKRTKLEPC